MELHRDEVPQRLHGALHEAVVPEGVRHQVEAEAVDRQVLQTEEVSVAPRLRIDGLASGGFEIFSCDLEELFDGAPVDARAEHEGEELRDVVLREMHRRELPVVGAEA